MKKLKEFICPHCGKQTKVIKSYYNCIVSEIFRGGSTGGLDLVDENFECLDGADYRCLSCGNYLEAADDTELEYLIGWE